MFNANGFWDLKPSGRFDFFVINMKFSVKIFFPLMILFFLCVNHFDGFEQDCILYTLQAINRIFPGRFIDDPAFMFGNQDAFSIFSSLYALFIKMLPIDKAALLFTLIIHCGVATSFVWLSYKWTKKFHCSQLALPVTLFFFSMYAYGEFRNDMWGTLRLSKRFLLLVLFQSVLAFGDLHICLTKISG